MKSPELKGGIYDLISNINDVEILKDLRSVVLEFIDQRKEGSDFWDELSPEQKKKLKTAIEESYDEKNWVSEADADKQIENRLNK